MKLIDAHKVQMKLFEECQNIRHFDKNREKSQIFADGIDFAWVMLDNTPTVEAIPIEWIKKKSLEFLMNKNVRWATDFQEVIDLWKVENNIPLFDDEFKITRENENQSLE